MGSGSTRENLHRVAVHVLGRRRFEVSGHFGLRASPGGIATPAFGPEPEVLRVAGSELVREVGTDRQARPLSGSTLAALASFAGVALDADFSAGPDSPAVGAADVPLAFEATELEVIAEWFDVAWRVLDGIVRDVPLGEGWSVIQLWPEHFDAGTALDWGDGRGVTLGFSAGDAFSDQPYAYVSVCEADRPGDPAYWNAPFGAALRGSPGAAHDGATDAFLRRGLELLAKG